MSLCLHTPLQCSGMLNLMWLSNSPVSWTIKNREKKVTLELRTPWKNVKISSFIEKINKVHKTLSIHRTFQEWRLDICITWGSFFCYVASTSCSHVTYEIEKGILALFWGKVKQWFLFLCMYGVLGHQSWHFLSSQRYCPHGFLFSLHEQQKDPFAGICKFYSITTKRNHAVEQYWEACSSQFFFFIKGHFNLSINWRFSLFNHSGVPLWIWWNFFKNNLKIRKRKIILKVN